MKAHLLKIWRAPAAAVVFGLLGLGAGDVGLAADTGIPGDFDHQGTKLFTAYQAVPEAYSAAPSGDRNLFGFYALRQYPGSPPRVPHPVEASFSGSETDCLSCHGKGGYAPGYGKFAPVTPHPENTLCYQCHAATSPAKPFVSSTWQSIAPPRLGKSFLPGAPPTIPHSLQLRENCIACHTGPGAVVEIRVEHTSRGNCRQCHVPAVQQAEVAEFSRKK
jgi:cytochrome c-type protein NapB